MRKWWSDGDSNPGPSACKADALPTELPPQSQGKRQKVKVEGGITLFYLLPFAFLLLGLVGVGGLEPPTSILSGSRSNQLSYTPTYIQIIP